MFRHCVGSMRVSEGAGAEQRWRLKCQWVILWCSLGALREASRVCLINVGVDWHVRERIWDGISLVYIFLELL